ncbi:MAG: 3'-5' exonuclease [Sphingobium sp.]|nr:MAG: 3'-5' exonuclease [Sphingobium sp.]
MILGYDSETSSLPLWHDPSDDPRQPSLLQLAMLKFDMDGNETDRFNSIVQPRPGCVIAPEAFDAHGITFERAMDEGIPAADAFDVFVEMLRGCELMVGHNESFDRRIMRITAAHHKGFKWEPPCPAFCTLYRSKYIVNLPPTPAMLRAGIQGPKSPSLTECIRFFFDEDLDGAHDAMVDIAASLRVFWHLVRERGVPMFKKPKAGGASRAPARRSTPVGDPFAAARAALGGAR